MSIIVACSQCGGSLKVPQEGLGKTVKCPLCQKTFTAQAAAERPGPSPSSKPQSSSPSDGESTVVTCTACKRSLKLPRSYLGRTVKCPLCKTAFTAAADGAAPERIVAAATKSSRPPAAPPSLPETGVVPREAVRAKSARAASDGPPRFEDDDLDDSPQSRRSRAFAFKIQVKKDPKRELKGQFQATATTNGLRLQQGKKWDLRVPVGSEARHQKGNVLTVDIEGRRVDLAIASFTLYRERLAQDLTRLLQGKRDGLDPERYQVPWYLYAPAVLPLGIPIITLGGAIPGALGFGLAGGCVAVAQRERWSVPVRLAVSLGLVLAGYGALAGLLVAAGKLRAPAPGAPAAGAPAATRRQPAPPRQPDVQPIQKPDAPVAIKKETPPPNVPDAEGRVFLPGDAIALAFPPNEPETLVTVGSNGTIRLWNTAEAREIASIPFKGVGPELTGMAVSPDGARALIIRHGGALQPIDLKQRVWEPSWQESLPGQIAQWAVAFAADGQTVATAHGNSTVKIWDAASHSLRHTLSGHKGQVHSVAIAPDSSTVASGDGETVRLWNARTGKQTGSFQAQKGGGGNLPAIWSLAFSPDGKTLAAGGNDGSVHLHDLASNSERSRLSQGFPVGAIAFSSDGARLASAGFGGKVIVWNTATGAKLAELDLKVQRINGVAFQPGRNRLAITGGRVVLWDVPPAGGAN
jgi:hypothetical protein